MNTFFAFLSAESILLAPVIEEPVKAIGVTFLAIRYPQVVDTKRKGLVLGGFAGLGFAFTENLYYATVPGTNIIARALLPVPMHVMASGIAGFGLVYFAQRRIALGASSSKFNLKAIGSLWTVAMVIHGQYNFLSYFGTAGSLLGLMVTCFVYYRLGRSLPENLRLSSLPGPVRLLRSTVQVRILKGLTSQSNRVSSETEDSRESIAFCINCGREISSDEHFCDSCGASQLYSQSVHRT